MHHLAERTEPKRFFLFSRVTYHTGRDQRVLPSNFFRHSETFFPENCFPQRVPLQFYAVLRQNGCLKTPKGPPFQFFGIVRLLFEIFFLINCDKNVDNFGSVSLLARQGLALACPGAPLGPFFEYVIFRKKFFEKFLIF